MACIIIPQYFKIECHIYTDNISEVSTKIMKEIAGLECRNAIIIFIIIIIFFFFKAFI